MSLNIMRALVAAMRLGRDVANFARLPHQRLALARLIPKRLGRLMLGRTSFDGSHNALA